MIQVVLHIVVHWSTDHFVQPRSSHLLPAGLANYLDSRVSLLAYFSNKVKSINTGM